MEEKRFVDCTTPVTQGEAYGIISKISEQPLAIPLIKLFQRASDENSYRKTTSTDPTLYGTPNVKGVDASLSIMQRHFPRNHVRVDFYVGSIDDLDHEFSRSDLYNLARIHAGPQRTGIWAAGSGDQMAQGIDVIVNDISLPSNNVRWMLEHLSWFSIITGEYLDRSQQPKFWTGDKRKTGILDKTLLSKFDKGKEYVRLAMHSPDTSVKLSHFNSAINCFETVDKERKDEKDRYALYSAAAAYFAIGAFYATMKDPKADWCIDQALDYCRTILNCETSLDLAGKTAILASEIHIGLGAKDAALLIISQVKRRFPLDSDAYKQIVELEKRL